MAKKIDSGAEERSRMRSQLMAGVKAGDRESCHALLDDVGRMLTGFLRPCIPDRNELQDVYQDTLMAFFQEPYTYQPSRPLKPWLFAIARKVGADHALLLDAVER